MTVLGDARFESSLAEGFIEVNTFDPILDVEESEDEVLMQWERRSC